MRTLPLRLAPGGDLRQEIERAALALPERSAFVLAGIGSLSAASIRFAAAETPSLLEEPSEILSLSGSVTPEGAHLHVAVATASGRVLGGHVGVGCTVRTTAEVLLVALPEWQLSRELDTATGYRELAVARRSPGDDARPPTSMPSSAVTASEIQAYLHAHIPLSAAMQATVDVATPDEVVLAAPLRPNINHRDTVFGGSASALAILSAWSLLHVKLSAAGHRTRLVIQRNSMHYEHAIPGDFTARALAPPVAEWTAFTRMLERKGRARIAVTATLQHAGREVGRFEGEFVALGTTGA